jgi:hypothetical protein
MRFPAVSVKDALAFPRCRAEDPFLFTGQRTPRTEPNATPRTEPVAAEPVAQRPPKRPRDDA